ncbi:Fic family protein [Verrucomicrobiaceae bacterium N1E253]|uniref:Fic family protein n=1 Tax=Oceaniferula marina TaxID=2748318 RepID=A0A851GGU5_9BACT|nr:Fic family protein [Oceaniferula marina]NWK56586.1 Fic family protein [Oceaniferula marina]
MEVSVNITAEILQLIASIDEFKGRWQALGAIDRDRLTQLRRTATIESVGSSTRIEGSRMSDAQVETLLANIEIEKFSSRDEQEVAGYARLMDLIFDSWEFLNVDENHLLQLHSTLLHHSTKDERHRGAYKTLDNHVAAFDEQGKQIGIVFETSSPFDTPAHMKALLEWERDSRQSSEMHALLRIGVFIVRFLAIHPFQDGNGRLSRALTTLFLLQSGYEYVPFASIERIIEANKDGYYRALRATQTSFNTTPDWNPWLVFFLRTLARQCEVLARKVEDHRVIQASGLSPLALEVLTLFEQHSSLSNREMVALTGSNRNTLKRTLSSLVEKRLLMTEGKGRSVRYMVAP